MNWLDEVKFDADGLVPVIAQDSGSARVLMVAWANREALVETASSGGAVYWSRSRKQLWHKGEESGHRQKVVEIRLDCDGDVVLYPEPPTALQNLRAILGLKVPNPLGQDVAVRGLGQVALGWALPRPVTQVLSLLPVSLWYGERPGALALSEETFSIED